ncbi:MAG: hypothetical protein PHY74_08230 [Candidatus Bathyarchaeota archaeon]|nr:hypothetical protein [Candidatus Bathyarchaeota archaeon]
MNRENYKIKRNKPKSNSKISKAKSQMLTKPRGVNLTSTKELRKTYSTKTEWITNVIPKLKEQ